MRLKLSIKLSAIALLLSSVALSGAICGNANVELTPITLKVWRVWDEEDTLKDVISAYKKSHPNVEFEYRKLRFEEYRDELLSAWAKGEGPDIFSIPNSWVGGYLEFMAPLPQVLEIPKIEIRTVLGFKKEKQKVLEQTKTYTIDDLRDAFVPAVVDDVVFYDENGQRRIYGLPYSIDNLALYYNRDMLNQANIPLPPTTWSELLVQIPKLVKESSQGELTQSAIALGTTNNIQRYVDILSLLMIQDGANMGHIDEKNQFRTTLSDSVKDSDGNKFSPGSHALLFYTDLANASKQAYTWNEEMPDSFEAFTQGQLAYFLGYSYHLPQITDAAPRLNFDVAPLPQVSLNQEANFANYWVESVYNNSDNINYAWDFLYFATQKEQVVDYVNATVRPSALREVIKLQIDQDEEIAPFVNQALTSRSWYHGKDYFKVEEAFTQMIDGVLHNELTEARATNEAQLMINQNEQLKE